MLNGPVCTVTPNVTQTFNWDWYHPRQKQTKEEERNHKHRTKARMGGWDFNNNQVLTSLKQRKNGLECTTGQDTGFDIHHSAMNHEPEPPTCVPAVLGGSVGQEGEMEPPSGGPMDQRSGTAKAVANACSAAVTQAGGITMSGRDGLRANSTSPESRFAAVMSEKEVTTTLFIGRVSLGLSVL